MAEAACRSILNENGDHAAAFELLGVIAHRRGQTAAGLMLIDRALALDPARVEAHNNRAALLMAAGRVAEAIDGLARAIDLVPAFADAHRNLGAAFLARDDADAAAACLQRALALDPQSAPAWTRLGVARQRLGQAAAAVASLDRALALAPDSAWVHYQMGNARRDLGRLSESAASLRHAVALRTDFDAAMFSLALTYLMAGRLAEGWRAYESRWRGSGAAIRGTMRKRATHAPEWRGETVDPGARLIVYKEQGWGDNIMFARYLPLLAGRFAEIAFYCPVTLERLLRRSLGATKLGTACLVSGDWTMPREARFTHAVPLLSLPRALGTTLQTVPAAVPYLSADPDAISAWRRRLAGERRPKVGLAWAGGRALALRSMKLAALQPLLSDNGIAWFSLCKAASPEDRAAAADCGLIDWMDECRDFADTAALIEGLDLVISIDTAVAHLAGALAKPVWLINRFESDWRWLRGRSDSPWYPTMRIFSQARSGDWASAVADMCAALAVERLAVERRAVERRAVEGRDRHQ